jgi:polysaccharide deacetylase family protein (PEP-CTERM system associated)
MMSRPPSRLFLATFDIEDWFHTENLGPTVGTADWRLIPGRVERNTHALLDLLTDCRVHATFFVLGWVARRYPSLVRRIADEGHEVGSHGDMHRRFNSLTRDALREDLRIARDTLEQVTGARVWGVRAPTFSISEAVLDVIAEAGYWYDSSFFGFKQHDRYGELTTRIAPGATVTEVRPGLLELPMPCVRVAGMTVPWAGGGYFRLIPYPVFRWGVARNLRAERLFMFYLHPWELDAAEPRPPGLTRTTGFRTYVGRRRVPETLRRLLLEFGSTRVADALRTLGYAAPGEARGTVVQEERERVKTGT